MDKVASKCQVVYQQIKTDINPSAVVGADETGAKVSGSKWWWFANAMWVWQTILRTFIVASDNKGFKTVEAFLHRDFLMLLYFLTVGLLS